MFFFLRRFLETFPYWPQKGQMHFSLIGLTKFDESRYLYLENGYFEVLHGAIIDADISGKFESSNDYSEWKGLMYKF